MRKIWNKIKSFFGFGKPELEIRATEIDAIVNTPKAEPTVIVVNNVKEAELPKGITVKKEEVTATEAKGSIVSEPKGITKTPKGITKGIKKTSTRTAKPAPVKGPKAKPAKEVKSDSAPKPAKKAPAKKASPVAKKAAVKVKRAWYNNGTLQSLIPVDQETLVGWTKGKLPKKDK